MNTCDRWREHLEDYGLGLAADAGLESHLAACTACARALAELRARVERLDDGVRQLVSKEPPPDLVQRVLAELPSTSARPAWFDRWRMAFATLAFVAVLATLALVVHRMSVRRVERDRASSAQTALSHWRSPTESLLGSPADSMLKSIPPLGKPYFEINPRELGLKRIKGGRDAK